MSGIALDCSVRCVNTVRRLCRDAEDADNFVGMLKSFLVLPDGIPDIPETESEVMPLAETSSDFKEAEDCFQTTEVCSTAAPSSVRSVMTQSAVSVRSKNAIRAASAEIACPRTVNSDKVRGDTRFAVPILACDLARCETMSPCL